MTGEVCYGFKKRVSRLSLLMSIYSVLDKPLAHQPLPSCLPNVHFSPNSSILSQKKEFPSFFFFFRVSLYQS